MNTQIIGMIGATATLGLTTVGALTGASIASSGPISPQIAAFGETVDGVVDAADLEAKTFTLRLEDDRAQDLTFNDETSFQLDGEASTAEAVLQTGAAVSATYDENGLASSVSRDVEE